MKSNPAAVRAEPVEARFRRSPFDTLRANGALGLGLFLAACAAAQPPLAHGSGAICKADGLSDLVGRPATADLGAAALKRSGARTLRWIQPGMAVTMDYRQDRLDVHLDARNVVTKLSCG
ncbi:MAG TPA: I78 family peptidase inhibitor [Sphingomonas sp.]|nr:I78 family peptidase inhibitor [Sphingomonas sp.]